MTKVLASQFSQDEIRFSQQDLAQGSEFFIGKIVGDQGVSSRDLAPLGPRGGEIFLITIETQFYFPKAIRTARAAIVMSQNGAALRDNVILPGHGPFDESLSV